MVAKEARPRSGSATQMGLPHAGEGLACSFPVPARKRESQDYGGTLRCERSKLATPLSVRNELSAICVRRQVRLLVYHAVKGSRCSLTSRKGNKAPHLCSAASSTLPPQDFTADNIPE